MTTNSEEDAGSNSPMATSFFLKMQHRFDEVEISENEGIPTRSFLNACRSIVPIFDLLGPTLFSPVKRDIEGNINKLEAKYQLDTSRFNCLQQMALQELNEPHAFQLNNATDALLWLKRALEFIYEFLQEFLRGNPNLSDGTHTAYSKTLRPFHGYIVQGIFAVVVRAVPSRTSFADMLLPLQDGWTTVEQDNQILQDSSDNMAALKNILKCLNDFYQQYDIDNKNKV